MRHLLELLGQRPTIDAVLLCTGTGGLLGCGGNCGCGCCSNAGSEGFLRSTAGLGEAPGCRGGLGEDDGGACDADAASGLGENEAFGFRRFRLPFPNASDAGPRGDRGSSSLGSAPSSMACSLDAFFLGDLGDPTGEE